MSRHCCILFRPTACFTLVLLAAWAAPALAATIQDTFTRPDSTNLGTTEGAGGFAYVEASPTNAFTVNSVDILNNELRVFGETTAVPPAITSNPGIALIGANLADISIAADLRLTLPNGPTANLGTYNYSGFVLRKNGPFTTTGTQLQNEGMVEVELQVGGALWIREVKNGALNALNTTNLFGMGGTNNNTYGAAGTLPMTFNGLPFDANGNGRLDPNEPFRLSANLIGNTLTVGVNGLQIFSGTTNAAAPAQALSYAGLYKNRFTSTGTLDITTPVFDNLVINGTPQLVAPILHTGNLNPASVGAASAERWVTMPGTVAAANNGPVTDGGTDAWNIRDTSIAGGSFANYQRALTPDQGNAAKTLGWSMKSRLRVIGIDDVLDGSIELSAFPDSPIGYTLWLGANEFGQAVVGEFGGALPGTLAVGRTFTAGAGYHDYEMIFNAGTQTADLFVDGSLALSNLLKLDRTGSATNNTQSLNRILWGSNSSAGMGEANYASVSFTIVPEPSSMFLLLMAISFGIALRRKDG